MACASVKIKTMQLKLNGFEFEFKNWIQVAVVAGFGGALLILLSAAVLVNTNPTISIQIWPIDSNIFIQIWSIESTF